MRLRGWVFAGLIAVVGAERASAEDQDREFAFGLGYSHLFWDGSHSKPLDEQGGLVLDGRLTWAVTPVAPERPQLRVGVGLDLAFYGSYDDDGTAFIDDDVIIITGDDYTRLSIIAPQVEVSWRQPIAGAQWYLEPGLAGVFMVGNYTTGQDFVWFVDQDENRWNVGGGGKAFLRLAYQRERWGLGVQGSYGYGWLDFGDDIGGDIQQGSIGVFYSHRF